MRFINKWSYGCAKYLSGALNENHQKRSVYYFSFQIIIGAVVKTGILLLVSLLLGILVPMLVISFSFSLLRIFAGGYHMDTYGKCLFVSMALFVTAAVISKYTYEYWNVMHLGVLIAVMFASGLYSIIRYAPRDTPNKPITEPQEIKKFKVLSVIYIFVCLAAVIILTSLNLNMYVISLCLGVLLELFAITPTGHRFFDQIKYGLNAKLET